MNIKKQSLSDQLLISCLNTNYGIEVASLTFLALGADMNASVYKAEGHNRISYFVKVKRGCTDDISVMIAELLHNAGIKQIILPIKTTHGQSSHRIENFTLIVYPFVKGQDGFNRSLTDNEWIKLGKTLRQVHEIDVPLSIQNQIRKEIYSSNWREVVRTLYIHIEAGPIENEIALKLVAFIKKNKRAIHRLVDRAEQLGQELKGQSCKFVLCHSDIHGGNVLIDENDSIFLVDWDDPIMAPKERDLMFIGGGVANVWNKEHEKKLFYKGYGITEVNLIALAYYRHERIVEDIAVLGQELLVTMDGGDHRPEMYKQFVDMFEPNGVVDIAFKTDDELVK